jgi:hypothetical protein
MAGRALDERGSRSGWAGVAAAALIVVFAAQAHVSAGRKSAILHETLYTYAGYQYLTRGDYRINLDSPPLLKQLAALPLLPLDLDPAVGPHDRVNPFVDRFFYENRVPADVLLARARLPFLALGLLLGIVIFRWTRELYGPAAGILALWLTAFNPALLGQAGFANHDFGLTCFSVATLYAAWRLAIRPTLPRALVTGIVLGLALATKFSGLLLIPTVMLLVLADAVVRPGEATGVRAAGRRVAWLAVVLVVAALTVWADYGFRVGAIRLDLYLKMFERVAPDGIITRLIRRLPPSVTLPAPLYVDGAVVQMLHGWIGHINYLFGEVSYRGWWYYYLVTFLYRVPIPLFIVALVRVATWRRAGRMQAWAEVWVLAYAVLTVVLFSLSRTQLGERYVLVVYPLAFVFLGGLWQPGQRAAAGAPDDRTMEPATGPGVRVAVGAALLSYAAGAWLIFPDHLTYFNVLAGGPDAGYRKIIEGVDLGQDAATLQRFVASRGIEEMKVSCFGCPAAKHLGTAFRPVGCKPRPGWIAVSVRHRVMPRPFLPAGCFDWLADHEPVARLGHSIHVFDIPGKTIGGAMPAAPGSVFAVPEAGR